MEAEASRVPMPRTLKQLLVALGVVVAIAVVLRTLPAPDGSSRVRAGADIRRAHTDNTLLEGGAFPRSFGTARAPYDGKGSCRLSGIITDQNGHAVEGCALSIEPCEDDAPTFFVAPYPDPQPTAARTDAAGRFAIDGVAAGRWLVGPSAPVRSGGGGPDAIAPVGSSILVAAGQTEAQMELHVHRGLYIRGSIASAHGPVDSFGFVYATLPGTHVMLNEMTDQHGKFVLGPLTPGRYSLMAHGDGDYRDSAALEASPGEEAVVLTLRPGGTISGWIEDAVTGDACQAKLTLSGSLEDGVRTVSAWSHDSGDFNFDGLSSGSYDICARTGERNVGFARSVKVREGETTERVKIRLERGCVLRVRSAQGRSGFVTMSSGGIVVGSAFLAPEGKLVEVVPAGRVTVRMEGRLGTTPEDRMLELGAGEEKEVAFGGQR